MITKLLIKITKWLILLVNGLIIITRIVKAKNMNNNYKHRTTILIEHGNTQSHLYKIDKVKHFIKIKFEESQTSYVNIIHY